VDSVNFPKPSFECSSSPGPTTPSSNRISSGCSIKKNTMTTEIPTNKLSLYIANIALFAGLLCSISMQSQTDESKRAESASSWKQVEDAMGRPGQMQPDGVIKFAMPRKDLHVTLNDVEIKPGLALGSWAAFKQDGGPSIAERINARLIAAKCVPFRAADNARVAQRGAMGGWDQVRNRLVGNGEHPMIYYFSTCKDSIRTIPSLQHDQTKPEDVDTDMEDHAGDDTRYACMSRPYMRAPASEDKNKNVSGYKSVERQSDSFKAY